MTNYEFNKVLINTIVKKLRSYGRIKLQPILNSSFQIMTSLSCSCCYAVPKQDPRSVQHTLLSYSNKYWDLRNRAFNIVKKNLTLYLTTNYNYSLPVILIYKPKYYLCEVCEKKFLEEYNKFLEEANLIELLTV